MKQSRTFQCVNRMSISAVVFGSRNELAGFSIDVRIPLLQRKTEKQVLGGAWQELISSSRLAVFTPSLSIDVCCAFFMLLKLQQTPPFRYVSIVWA